MAEFHPFGIKSGPPDNPSYDPTCFWFPNPACCIGMLEHVGFKEVKRISPSAPVGGVFYREGGFAGKGQSSGGRYCAVVIRFAVIPG